MSEGKQVNHKALIDEMAGHLDHFNADTFQAKDLERLINQVIYYDESSIMISVTG